MTHEPRFVNMTPTPEGMRQIIAVLRDQIQQSQQKVEQAQALIDEVDMDSRLFSLLGQAKIVLLLEGLEALISQERLRIQHIEDGLTPGSEPEPEDEKEV